MKGYNANCSVAKTSLDAFSLVILVIKIYVVTALSGMVLGQSKNVIIIII